MPRPFSITNLKIEYTSPRKGEDLVDLNKAIELKFNLDIDTKNIEQIYLYEDGEFEYTDGLSLEELNLIKIKGTFTYKDRVLIFTPINPLKSSCKYIFCIPKNIIKSITGSVLSTECILEFYTSVDSPVESIDIKFPHDGTTINDIKNIEIKNPIPEPYNRYLVQISKIKTFETTIYEKIIISSDNTLELNTSLGDGLYFIRARALNGEYGAINSFIVQSYSNTSVVEQDSDSFRFEEVLNEECRLSENNNFNIQVSEKTNVIYLKYNGKIDINDIDFYETQCSYTEYDSDDDSNNVVDGTVSIIYDEKSNESYVVFSPFNL